MKRDWPRLCERATIEIETLVTELPPPLRSILVEKLPMVLEPTANKDLPAAGIAADTLGIFIGGEFADNGTNHYAVANRVSS